MRSISPGIDCQPKCPDFSESNTFWTSQFAHVQRLYSVICLSCTSTLRYQRSVSRIQGHLPGLASSNDNLHGLRNTSRSVHSFECPDSQAYSRLCRTRPASRQTICHKSPRPSQNVREKRANIRSEAKPLLHLDSTFQFLRGRGLASRHRTERLSNGSSTPVALIQRADGTSNEHSLVGCLGSNTTHLGSALGLTGHRDLTLLSQSSAPATLRRRGLALMSRNRFRANSIIMAWQHRIAERKGSDISTYSG